MGALRRAGARDRQGNIRFHAIYWPAILLSAGEPLPTAIFVHDYLTVDGHKLSKTTRNTHDPAAIADRYGRDALRWWFLRDVGRTGDADFREDLLVARANELADGLGNLVNRTSTLARRFRPQGVGTAEPSSAEAIALHAVIKRTPGEIDNTLARVDFRAATASLWRLVDEANRFVTNRRPWELAKAEETGDVNAGADLDEVLGALLVACHLLARELQPSCQRPVRGSRALAEGDPELGRRLFTKVSRV